MIFQKIIRKKWHKDISIINVLLDLKLLEIHIYYIKVQKNKNKDIKIVYKEYKNMFDYNN